MRSFSGRLPRWLLTIINASGYLQRQTHEGNPNAVLANRKIRCVYAVLANKTIRFILLANTA